MFFQFDQTKRINLFSLQAVLAVVVLISACTPAKQRGWDRVAESEKSSTQKTNAQKTTSNNQSTTRNDKCTFPYKVRYGQTLSGIAYKCKVNMYRLADANGINPPYRIYVGQELEKPLPKSVQQTKSKQAQENKSSPKVIVTKPAVEKINPSDLEPPKSNSIFGWPAKQKQHRFVADSTGKTALVIKGKWGDEVYAAEDGEVVYSGEGIQHYGRMVILKHSNSYLTIYAHNSTLLVIEGEKVKRGQLISKMGMTGTVKSPQLYVEVRYRGRKTDAKRLFSSRK